MNINTYGLHYSKFHHWPVAALQNNMIVFDLKCSPFNTEAVVRMSPSECVIVNSDKPFILALKAHFKSNVPASIMCNDKKLWTICLGKERWIYPVSRDVDNKTHLHLYATTYFVKNPGIIQDYLKNFSRAYDHVYYDRNTTLYLDNQDLPYPGGSYFDACEPAPYYRICYLTHESMDYVSKLALEWQSRREVETIQCLTRKTTAMPKFIDFKPTLEAGLFDSTILSHGLVHRKLSARKPELIIQDILLSYYKNFHRNEFNTMCLGLILEWPLSVSFEGSWTAHSDNPNRKMVALSINGNQPQRVIYASCPYDRYVEYREVPAIPWTPISFVNSTLLTDVTVKKVVLDTVVIGVAYKDMFFCFSQPLLEGYPTKKTAFNSQYLLSIATHECMMKDKNIQIIQNYRLDEHYSIYRVHLTNIPYETWCIAKHEKNFHPIFKNIQLPYLVNQWLELFRHVKRNPLDIDTQMVRLALTLSKHNVCYHLNMIPHKNTIHVSDNQIKFNFHQDVIKFINNARLASKTIPEEENMGSCTIS